MRDDLVDEVVRPGHLRGNQTVIRVLTTTLSSRRRIDGVEDDATIQHERAVKF